LKDTDFSLAILKIDELSVAAPTGFSNPVLETIAGMPLWFAQQYHSIVFGDLAHARFQDWI
jgi:hypothetical protein